MVSKLHTVLVLGIAAFGPGCGGNDSGSHGSPLPSSWTATCTGTYTSAVYSSTGPFEVSLADSDGKLTGSLTIAALDMTNSSLTGTAQGTSLLFGDVEQRISFTGTVQSTNSGFTGTGSYSVSEVSDHGTWIVNCAYTTISGAGGSGNVGSGGSAGAINTVVFPSTGGSSPITPYATGGNGGMNGTSAVCQVVGSVAISDARGVVAGNGYVYVAAGTEGLVVVDASNPLSPKRVGALGTGETATALALSGQTAYVLDATAGLVIVDVSNPAQPVKRGSLARPSNAAPNPGDGAVLVRGSVAYVSGLDAWGVFSVDVSDASAPKNLGNTGNSPFGVNQLAIQGNWLFATGWDGLVVINVSNPDAPVEVASLSDLTFASDFATVAQTAYIPFMSGLQIVDVSSPLTPLEQTSYQVDGGANAIATVGNTAYVGSGDNLLVLDATTPSAPTVVGQCALGVSAARLAVANRIVYAAAGTGGFRVVQINQT